MPSSVAGRVQLRARHSGMCVERGPVVGGVRQVWQRHCRDIPDQQFRFIWSSSLGKYATSLVHFTQHGLIASAYYYNLVPKKYPALVGPYTPTFP
ncbi:MAG: hypothetical protein KC503_47200 [Myxococcales bacterium]|nr:hypothetical protein [Myxococcales bacterium]